MVIGFSVNWNSSIICIWLQQLFHRGPEQVGFPGFQTCTEFGISSACPSLA